MKRAFGAPGPKLEPHFFARLRSVPKQLAQTILSPTTVPRLSFRAERSVVEESAARFVP